MSVSAPYLGFAFRDGILTSIERVESGLACQCNCPACGGRLVARKGAIRQHHFAHWDSHECPYGPQTVAHLLGKKLLAREKKLTVPPVYWQPRTGYILFPFKDVRFEEADVEHRLGEVVPDIVLRDAHQRELLVEIVVTHRSSPEKVQKLVDKGISALEVYLPRCEVVTLEMLRTAFQSTSSKLWLYNAKAADRRRATLGSGVDGPHRTYTPSGRYYAYFPAGVCRAFPARNTLDAIQLDAPGRTP